MPAIPDRVWELLSEDERDKLRLIVDGWRHEPRVECPSCGARLGIKLRITAGAVTIDESGNVERIVVEPQSSDHQPVPLGLTANEKKLLDDAAHSGLLKAFGNAVREDKPTNIPKDIGAHFLTFLRTAAAKTVPAFAIEYFNDQYAGRLMFWSAQGIIAVTVDGILCEFVPLRFICGATVSSIGTGKMKGRLMASERELDIWVKGRFGYVPLGSGHYLDAMRQKNIGKFGAIIQ